MIRETDLLPVLCYHIDRLGVGQLNLQRRLTGHIHKLVNTIFYNKQLR